MDQAYDVASEASSCEEFAEEMHSDDLIDFSRHEQHSPSPSQPPVVEKSTQQAQYHRPPPICTDWEASVDKDENGHETILNNSPVTFNLPRDSVNIIEEITASGAQFPSSSMIHFQNPKRYNSNISYPTQRLHHETHIDTEGIQREKLNNTPNPVKPGGSSSLTEVTPAFLRRAAQELGVTNSINAARAMSSNTKEPVPPNALMYRKDRPETSATSNHLMNHPIPDSSFFGADASALDGTFVSIRDLNDDDDVPSVDNSRWNSSTTRKNVDYPTETSSLLKGKRMPWQGGFFGSQIEKEDRKERKKIMRARNSSYFSEWMWAVRTVLTGSEKNDTLHANISRGSKWEANHTVRADFMAHRDAHTGSGGFARKRIFSLFLIGALCLHMALCGLHDFFLRYIAYRNPTDDIDAEVSWNGEGEYIPAFWVSFEGRVFNPFVGPGARTLTAFGALVPGLVLSKGQGWRVGTSSFQESSFMQIILHVWALKSAIGGPMTGVEWRRGTFVVSCVYLISAFIGQAWSIVIEPGRLITSSGMGITGVLVAATVERACYPESSKDDDDEGDVSIHRKSSDGGFNAVSSSSNEQFEFQRPNSRKMKQHNRLNNGSPALLLLLELLLSWWAAYSSLPGTATAAMAGLACALLLFVGNPPPGSFGRNASEDLPFNETPPPPPPPLRFAGGISWRDDDSADTSVEAGKEAFTTPLMRRSIMADEEDEEEPLGMRSSLRKRNLKGLSDKPPVVKGRMISLESKDSFSPSRVIARVIGVLLALLLTLIPASLIATGEGPSSEVTRASVLGCTPMRILYKADDRSDTFECAGGCIPFSRERIARNNEGMRAGRCDTVGYRCMQQSGTMTLRNYLANVGIYVVPSADGSCSNTADVDDQGYKNIDDADAETADASNGEVEGVQ
ncbi:hypothetical protein ACHAW5_005965 [Stephanodiscus triporus]|uniref:rhomboid protease n=1 Tax=Stephanodiscus triporus TaxID=2934178 RepID=A0ABD3MGB3_9STRA